MRLYKCVAILVSLLAVSGTALAQTDGRLTRALSDLSGAVARDASEDRDERIDRVDAASLAPTIASTSSTISAQANGGGQTPPPSFPLALQIGDSQFLIGGFMDLTSITRSTATGNGIGTNFSNFPFSTTATGTPNPQAHLSETRFSAQNSRLSLQATSKVGDANLKGYVEADFLGNTAQNLNVTSNSDTLRLRLYWAQYTQGKFEFLAGQSWSLLVPGRNGISPMPGDLFYTQNVDTNYQMGLIWQRVPGVRFALHPNNTVALAVAAENPEQYVGGAVVLPKAFPAFEVDTGSGSSAVGTASPTPNLYPDITGKIAFDPHTGSSHQHVDAAVMLSGFKTYNPSTNESFTKNGVSGSLNAILEATKNVHFIATNFFSNGGGRQIANTGTPDFIVNADFSLSLVQAFAGIYGAEVAAKKSLIYGYYSIDRINQRTALDADGTTQIGYGITGSQAANRTIQESTLGLTQTIFRDPNIGGLQLMFQASYLTRTPFSVPVGTPASAHLKMLYVNVRYLLP